MLLPNLIFETNCCVFLLLLLAVAFGPSLWATFQWCSQQERCGAAASCLHDADAYLTLPLDYNCPIFCRTLICGAGGGATTPGRYFPSKFIITCQGCKTMMQAPKQCRQLTCYKCKAVIAAATYPQLDKGIAIHYRRQQQQARIRADQAAQVAPAPQALRHSQPSPPPPPPPPPTT